MLSRTALAGRYADVLSFEFVVGHPAMDAGLLTRTQLFAGTGTSFERELCLRRPTNHQCSFCSSCAQYEEITARVDGNDRALEPTARARLPAAIRGTLFRPRGTFRL